MFFGVSTAIVTHIPRKMCHFCGVGTGLVTHIPAENVSCFCGVGKALTMPRREGV